MNRSAIEIAFAVYQTSNSCWFRPSPYLVEMSRDGILDYRSFDGAPVPPLTGPQAIRNVVRDDATFRCPAMDPERALPAYRAAVKMNRHEAEFLQVECLVDPSHNDPQMARFFREPYWVPDDDLRRAYK